MFGQSWYIWRPDLKVPKFLKFWNSDLSLQVFSFQFLLSIHGLPMLFRTFRFFTLIPHWSGRWFDDVVRTVNGWSGWNHASSVTFTQFLSFRTSIEGWLWVTGETGRAGRKAGGARTLCIIRVAWWRYLSAAVVGHMTDSIPNASAGLADIVPRSHQAGPPKFTVSFGDPPEPAPDGVSSTRRPWRKRERDVGMSVDASFFIDRIDLKPPPWQHLRVMSFYMRSARTLLPCPDHDGRFDERILYYKWTRVSSFDRDCRYFI